MGGCNTISAERNFNWIRKGAPFKFNILIDTVEFLIKFGGFSVAKDGLAKCCHHSIQDDEEGEQNGMISEISDIALVVLNLLKRPPLVVCLSCLPHTDG